MMEVIATLPPFGLVWCLCFVAQGFALQSLGLLSHDAFIHRRIWGDRGSWIGAVVSSYPVLLCPTWYLMLHRDHHAYLGGEGDTETYKQDLDTLAKRLLFLTAPGDMLAKSGKLSSTGTLPPAVMPRTEAERRHLARERRLLRGFVGVVL